MKRKIQKLIDENFAQTEVFNDNEEDFAVGNSVNEILDDGIEDLPSNAGNLIFKSKVFPADLFSESPKRKKVATETRDFFDSPSEQDSEDEQEHHESSNIDSDDPDLEGNSSETNSEKMSEANNGADDSESENGETEESMNSDDSDIEDDINSAEETEGDVDLSGVYSKKMLDSSVELRKATAVTNQLSIFDNLMENRILLQKCVTDVNKLPSLQQTNLEAKTTSIDCLERYLMKLVALQKKLRHNTTNGEHLEDDDYDTFRNKTIEHWYNRTKGARFNFTAFEQPLLKQIQSDKTDLIQKTYLRHAEQRDNLDETNPVNASMQVDVETVNDDDFYHKLLRHYIRRKTANISDSTQLGRQWIKLQNLRSKMKRKIDTRRTKGRKIKFDPHNKLINFMAVQNLRRWPEESINELFSSVFGKNIMNSY